MVGLVRTAGLEPTLPEGKQILSLLRLPISPRPHAHGHAMIAAAAKGRWRPRPRGRLLFLPWQASVGPVHRHERRTEDMAVERRILVRDVVGKVGAVPDDDIAAAELFSVQPFGDVG